MSTNSDLKDKIIDEKRYFAMSEINTNSCDGCDLEFVNKDKRDCSIHIPEYASQVKICLNNAVIWKEQKL